MTTINKMVLSNFNSPILKLNNKDYFDSTGASGILLSIAWKKKYLHDILLGHWEGWDGLWKHNIPN
jgi:hypothetical protein